MYVCTTVLFVAVTLQLALLNMMCSIRADFSSFCNVGFQLFTVFWTHSVDCFLTVLLYLYLSSAT